MKLTRIISTDDSILGILEVGDVKLFTLENLWLENKRNVSCIPKGKYDVVKHGWEEDTPLKYKRVWRLEDVPHRSGILIHAGNYAKDTYGCILVGTKLTVKNGKGMVLNSRKAIEILRSLSFDHIEIEECL